MVTDMDKRHPYIVAKTGRPGPPGSDMRPTDAAVEATTMQVLRWLADRVPRVDILEKLAPMPVRTVDDYIKRAKELLREEYARERPELVALTEARMESLAKDLTEDGPRVALERNLAEVRGVLGGKGTAVAVQVNVGADGQPAAGDLSRLSAAQAVVLEWLTAVYEGETCQAPVDAVRQVLVEVERLVLS